MKGTIDAGEGGTLFPHDRMTRAGRSRWMERSYHASGLEGIYPAWN